MNKCIVCDIEISEKAKTCSPKCRKIASRVSSVTSNVSVTQEVEASVTFSFTIVQRPGSKLGDEDWNEAKQKVRKAKYWYDIPLAAVPVYQKDWPKMPDFMNGRQYFLWWKNDFEVKDGVPVILNPFPPKDNVVYYKAGEGSRRWGA